jgi:hypothetical protein
MAQMRVAYVECCARYDCKNDLLLVIRLLTIGLTIALLPVFLPVLLLALFAVLLPALLSTALFQRRHPNGNMPKVVDELCHFTFSGFSDSKESVDVRPNAFSEICMCLRQALFKVCYNSQEKTTNLQSHRVC